MPDATRHLILDNGLHLTLRQASRLKRCAAALRVEAGSHDAPAAWPGLAHFLEHLFFLGTARFPLQDGLMRHVQGVGGQLNASTGERATDFFFEVPPPALAGSLERLCQMLAEPDLTLERQVGEREVIHAEFIAWSRDSEAQRRFKVLRTAAPGHPLAAFHAGNRHTLPLRNPAFQQALRQFHRQFYRGAGITLSLCGPQSLDALQILGKTFGSLFAQGTRHRRAAPPAMASQRSGFVSSTDGMDLWFCHQGLPDGADQALEWLLAWLSDSRPGGWLDALRRRGWLRGCEFETLYSHAGQLLWQVRVRLSRQASANEVQALLHDWLGSISQAGQDAALHAEFALLQASRALAANALELAQRDSVGKPWQALDAQGREALRALLADLPGASRRHWQLPPGEPLLQPLPDLQPGALPQGLAVDHELPACRGFAALYLRWQIRSPAYAPLSRVLEQSLQPLQARARRVALHLRFEACGRYWQLRCMGRAPAVIRAVAEALAIVNAPGPDAWQALPPAPPPSMPIRALLAQLPGILLGESAAASPSGAAADQAMLELAWQQARWQGLASGFSPSAQAALSTALRMLAGQPASSACTALGRGLHWHHLPGVSSEHALLLFCPLPGSREAEGRLLARLLQGPVYQRLRVELQLGYAVFSGFRQLHGHGGLLFGVQSPHASPACILGHLRELLESEVHIHPAVSQALAEQFEQTTLDNAEQAEWTWQAHLARRVGGLQGLRRAIHELRQADLDATLQEVREARHGWVCLATAALPAERMP